MAVRLSPDLGLALATPPPPPPRGSKLTPRRHLPEVRSLRPTSLEGATEAANGPGVPVAEPTPLAPYPAPPSTPSGPESGSDPACRGPSALPSRLGTFLLRPFPSSRLDQALRLLGVPSRARGRRSSRAAAAAAEVAPVPRRVRRRRHRRRPSRAGADGPPPAQPPASRGTAGRTRAARGAFAWGRRRGRRGGTAGVVGDVGA